MHAVCQEDGGFLPMLELLVLTPRALGRGGVHASQYFGVRVEYQLFRCLICSYKGCSYFLITLLPVVAV